MLVLKLRRTGKKHQPSYRLIVNERRSKVDGRNVDSLGWYNPQTKEYQLNKERVLHWIKNGAQKTDTVHNLLIRAGIITGNKIAVNKKSKEVDQIKTQKNMENQLINQVPEEGQSPEVSPEAPVEPVAPAEMPSESKPEEEVSTEGMPMPEEEKPADNLMSS